MRLIKVALANVKTTVGAVRSNVQRARAMADKMSAEHVTLAVFPEQLVSGYPPEDLVQWHKFVEVQRKELEAFAKALEVSHTVFVLGVTVALSAHRYNCAAVVHRGRVLGLVPKEKLPTYNVFYEKRTFTRGTPFMREDVWDGVPLGDMLFRFDWGVLGVEVCEDIWTPDGPMRRRCNHGAEIVCNVSASPYRLGVQSTRREMIATRSSDNQCTIAYANQVGGQDGLIFDGGGFVSQNGRLLHESARFVEGFETTVLDLDRTQRLRAENTTWRSDAVHAVANEQKMVVVEALERGADRSTLKYPVPPGVSFFLPPPAAPRVEAREAFCEELLDALALGLGDYFEKNRFKLIGIALSGGRDSLLALLIAWRYAERRFGPAKKAEAQQLIRTFYMPTRYSSSKTQSAAELIAKELGVPFAINSIEEAFARELDAAKAMLQPGESLNPITEQNIQARIRGARMWNWSNATGGLFLQTGNMSEKAMGYTTIGGDLEGGISVISNLPKTVVIYLLDYLAEKTGFQGIKGVLSHPAGPELAANQEGEKELMPFPILDACFALYAGEKLAPSDVKLALQSLFPQVPAERLGENVDRFFRYFSQSIYKWVQAPLGLHVGNLDLDRERALQLPVVQSLEWGNEK
ncbi:MAG: NAD(+) synthase [Deltaproteobacteria bacterium]|nr:NAD(+) synthase [Deltaproteobacteria bacterium]